MTSMGGALGRDGRCSVGAVEPGAGVAETEAEARDRRLVLLVVLEVAGRRGVPESGEQARELALVRVGVRVQQLRRVRHRLGDVDGAERKVLQ